MDSFEIEEFLSVPRSLIDISYPYQNEFVSEFEACFVYCDWKSITSRNFYQF